MRFQHKKLQRFNSTPAERIIGEILKNNKIKFKAKVVLFGREVDFLIGNNVIEIGNHPQDSDKNKTLVENGYNLMQLSNLEVISQDRIKLEKFIKSWLQVSQIHGDIFSKEQMEIKS